MTYSNVSLSSTSSTRTWRHGEFPMPDWVSRHMAGETEANGTFALETDLGRARVHLGNVVIERNGRIWVRPIEEFCEFMHGLDMAIETEITNVGPGKVRLFGASKRLFGEEKDQTGKGVIPTSIDHDLCAQSRRPMDIIFQG